jgi:hypothetical protein
VKQLTAPRRSALYPLSLQAANANLRTGGVKNDSLDAAAKRGVLSSKMTELPPHFIDTIAIGLALGLAFALLAAAFMWLFRLLAFPWSGIGQDVRTFEDADGRVRFILFPLVGFVLGALCWAHVTDWLWPDDPLRKASAELTAIEKSIAGIGGNQQIEPLSELGRKLSGLTVALSELDKSLRAMQPAIAADLSNRIEGIEVALTRIGDRLPIDSALSPPDQLKGIVDNLSEIKVSLGRLTPSASPNLLFQHISLIEAMLLDPVKAPPVLCEMVDRLPELAKPTPSEVRLLALAQRQHLTLPGRYQVTRRQLFFDAQAPELSEIGRRVLRLIAQYARQNRLALVIRSEADAVSDGSQAEAMARERVDTVAEYLDQDAPVPIVSIAVAAANGDASEPYRRVVRVDLLKLCEPVSASRAR